MTAVGLLGLGLIGQAAASRLLAAGFAVTGHDPAAGRGAALEARGGRAADPATVWAGADPVLLAVFDAGQAEPVLAAAPEGAGRTALLLTTCDPPGVERLGRVAAGRGIALVEAPISGTSAQLSAGGAVIYLAGDPAAVARARPVAEALCPKVEKVGALGQGARVKLMVNLVLGLNRAALAEGLAFAEGGGLDPLRALDLLRGSAAAAAVMATKGPKMARGDFAPEGRVAQSAKDFGLILSQARAAGLGLPFARTYAAMMEDCLAAGEGDLDNAAVIRAIRRAGGGDA